MTEGKTHSEPENTLRQRAEKVFLEKAAGPLGNMATQTPEEVEQVLHELRVHQIELEMQNEELRQAQTQLDISQARYFDLYDLAPVGYFTLSKTGLILEMNLTACSQVDKTRGTLIKQRFSSLILSDDQDIFYRHRKLLFETGAPQVYELRLMKKDAAPFWVRIDSTLAKDTDGMPICRATMIDINERKRAEEAQRETSARMAAIFEGARDAIFIADVATGVILDANVTAARLVNRPLASLVGLHQSQLHPPEQAERYRQQFSRRAGQTAPSPIEGEAWTSDGRRVPVEISASTITLAGGPTAMVGIFRDITERKQAEEEQRETEQHFTKAFEYASIGMALVSPEGHWLRVNRAVCQMLGRSAAELLATTFQAITHPDDLDADLAQVRQMLRGDISTYQMEKRYFHQSGAIVWALLSVSLVKDEQGTPRHFISQVVDITERKQAEAALQASEGKFRAIADYTVDWEMWFSPDGTLLWVNPAVERETGYTIAECFALPRFPDSLIHENDRERMRSAWQEVLAGSRGNDLEFRFVRKDGDTRWGGASWQAIYGQNGQPLGHRTSVRDITARKQMEEELKRSESLFRLDFESAPVGRCLVGLDGRFLKTNEAFRTMLRRSGAELQDLTFLDMTHPEDRAVSQARVQQLRVGEISRLDLEKRYLTSDQQTVWGSVRAGLVRDEAGSALHFSVHIQDITERKQAEETLLEREEQLRSIASSIPGAIYQFDRRLDGVVKIPFMSEGARLLFDRPLEELQDSLHLFDDVHPEDVPGLWASIEASAKDLTPWSTEFRLVPKTAPLRWLRGASTPHRMPDGGISWYGVLLDITEQKRSDEQIRLQHTLSLALAAASDLHQGLRLCLENALQATGLDAGGFYLVEETGALDFHVPQGLTAEFVQAVSRYEADSDHTRLIMAGLPVYARFEDLSLSLSEAERQEGLRFIAIIPLRHEGKVIGCMNVASHTADNIPPVKRQVVETIAATATQAIARLNASDRLRSSEILLNETQRLSKIGGWEWDVGRQRMHWTEETYRIHDLSAQDFAPGSAEHIRRSASCYVPEHQAAILEAFRQCAERGEAYDLEVPFTSVKGRSMWVRTTAQAVWEGNRIVKVVGNLQDITERKRVEQALRESEEQFRAANDASLDALLLLRSERDETGEVRDFVFVDVNRRAEEMLRMSRDQLLGKRLCEALPINREAGFFEKYKRVVDTDIPLDEEFFLPETHVPTAWYYHQVVKVHDGIFICHRDITERKLAEEEKRSLQARLQRSEKMEALGQLAGGVAHDLNNVLGVTSIYSELLQENIPEGSPLRKSVDAILSSTQKAADIIQDLLTLARRGVMASEVINLNSVISGFLKTPTFEKIKDYHSRVTFKTEYDKNLLNIKGSPVHLEKTVMNLVSNAAEAISGKGEVTVRTASRYLDNPVHGYDTVKEGDYAVLTISDTGTGIPAESIGKIFEPFYTKKTMGRSGTGLGLAIVWGTVKDHNGYIDVQTELEKGTTFTLYFPVTREEQITPQQKVPIERYMGKGESVLVVDDIAEQRDIATRLMTRLGYEVQAIASGEEAVEYLKTKTADLLILDMIMDPGIDGLETYKRILKINPKQKAIIVSGFSETERVKEVQKLGAGAYVKKPYMMEKIGVAVRDELDRK
jgi:PAS domain S-box-containing protein